MVVRSNRFMALALVSCMAFSQVSFAGAPLTSNTSETSVSSNIISDIGTYALYSALAIVAASVYRLKSKDICGDVDFNFSRLMRNSDGSWTKFENALAWWDRWSVGQEYKSSKMKAGKSGEIEVGKAQEPLGALGVGEANLKPALIGVGSAAFLYKLIYPDKDIFNKTLDQLSWGILAAYLGLELSKDK
jgi:hypothetical protein